MKIKLTALVILVILASCKKDRLENPAQTSGKKLTAVTYSGTFSNSSIQYDNTGRVVKVENDYSRVTYEFNGNTVLYKNFEKSENRYVGEVTGTLDNKGRMTSGTGSYSYDINHPYTSQLSFEYDASGYLSKETMNNSNGQTYVYEYTTSDGDVTTIKSSLNGQLQFIEDYEYFSDKPDKTNLEYNKFDWYTNGLFGKTNQHLLKSGMGKLPNANNPSWTNTYSYEMDTDGYQVKSTVNSSAWGIYSVNYTYNQ